MLRIVWQARRLGLSASAMSRALARLRAATGDRLLVRAGRGIVPTADATDLRNRVHELAQDARVVLRPVVADLDLAQLKRSFILSDFRFHRRQARARSKGARNKQRCCAAEGAGHGRCGSRRPRRDQLKRPAAACRGRNSRCSHRLRYRPNGTGPRCFPGCLRRSLASWRGRNRERLGSYCRRLPDALPACCRSLREVQ